MFPFTVTTVIQIPEFRTLTTRVPLSELIAMRKDPFFGTRFLFVASSPSEDGVEPISRDCLKQTVSLKPIPGSSRCRIFGHLTVIYSVLYASHDQADPQFLDPLVSESKYLGKIMTGIYMQNRKSKLKGPACFDGQVQQNSRVFATGEQKAGPLKLGNYLSDDEYGFRFQSF